MIQKFRVIELSVFALIFQLSAFDCFANSSQVLLAKLSRNAVDFRKNQLPTLLTDATRVESTRRVIELTLRALQLQKEEYKDFAQDQDILECFIRPIEGGQGRDCDPNVTALTEGLLFKANDPDPEWFSKVEVLNPTYETVRDEYAGSILVHDTDRKGLISVLKSKRLGKTSEEDWKKFAPYQDLLVKYFSLPLKEYTGIFLQWFPQEMAQTGPFFSNRGFRFIFKPDLFKRWDFHLSGGHIGAKFDAQPMEGSSYQVSFGPTEFRNFAEQADIKMKKWGDYKNEVIFYNPIPLSEVQEVAVSEAALADVEKLFLEYGINIPIKVASQAGEWDLNLVPEELSNNKETEGDLKVLLDTILSNSIIKRRFESFQSSVQENNVRRLGDAFRDSKPEDLDPENIEYEPSKWLYINFGKDDLLELRNDPGNREKYEQTFNKYFPKENDRFIEKWMEYEVGDVVPIWETDEHHQ